MSKNISKFQLDLRKTSSRSGLDSSELKPILSGGKVSIDTLTTEKSVLAGRNSSDEAGILRKLSQDGFGAIEAIVAVCLVVAVGGLGYFAYQNNADNTATDSQKNSQTSVSSDVPSAPSIDNTADLDTAQQTLDQTNLDASDGDISDLNQNLSGL